MVGIKPLLPSAREKKRYVAIEVISKSKVSFQSLVRTVWGSVLSFVGELEAGKAGMIMVGNTYNQETQKGIIRVNNKYVNELKASLSLISNIDEQPVIVRTLGVSGIINKAQKKYLSA